MNILCVCAYGQNRSRMAAELLRKKGHVTRYAGIDKEAPNPLKHEDWMWAQAIVFARERHKQETHAKFGIKEQEFVLDVTDNPQDLPEIWLRLRISDPESFYREYTLPRINLAVEKIQQYLKIRP